MTPVDVRMAKQQPAELEYASNDPERIMPKWVAIVTSVVIAGSASVLLGGWRWIFWPLLLNAAIISSFYVIGDVIGGVLNPAYHDFEALWLVLFLSIYGGIILLSIRLALSQRRAVVAAGAMQAAPTWLWKLIAATLQVLAGLVGGTVLSTVTWTTLIYRTTSIYPLVFVLLLVLLALKLVVGGLLMHRRASRRIGIGVLLSIFTGGFMLLLIMAGEGLRVGK